MKSSRLYEQVKYNFKADELRELGAMLARETQAVYDLRDQKAEATAAINARIKQADRRASDLTLKINNGYELREVEVMQELEEPRPGMKRIRRMDTGEHLRDEPMSAEEMQSSFGFREPEPGTGGESDAR
jgi:hypothetical protein